MVKIEYTVEQIASILSGTIEGNSHAIVRAFGKIESAEEGELTFLANAKYEPHIYTTQATAVLVSREFVPQRAVTATLVRVDDPYNALALLMQMVSEQVTPNPKGISDKALIGQGVILGEDCYVGAGAVIEAGAVIGDGCKIYPSAYIGHGSVVGKGTIIYANVSVYYGTRIGERCIIHAGAVIGADGFGFAPQLDGYHKIPQLGNVIIEDDVEIGANSCVDRAVMGSTIIRKGAKIDNLVQVAHNCEVGPHTVLAAQVGMAGSSSIGAWCQAGGQVGISGHLKIGDRVQIGGQTGILGNIADDRTILGSPAMDAGLAMRAYSILPKLPELYKKIGQLERELAELKSK